MRVLFRDIFGEETLLTDVGQFYVLVMFLAVCKKLKTSLRM